jgi:hypothetical protein
MKLTKEQESKAKQAYKSFCDRCNEMHADRNQHDGVAAFLIAKALMKVTPSLKFFQAHKWALNWLAEQWS